MGQSRLYRHKKHSVRRLSVLLIKCAKEYDESLSIKVPTHTWYTAHLHAGNLGSADTESIDEKISPPETTDEQSEEHR